MAHAPTQPCSSVDNSSPSKMKALLESDENEEINESCGFEVYLCKHSKRFPISCLNYFTKPVFLLLFLCFAHIGHTFLAVGLLSAVISTLEQRFHFRSSETGLIASCYDIGVGIAVLFVTYIGGKGHKALWIGWGMVLCGIGATIFALPHFLASAYTFGKEKQNICNSSFILEQCIPSQLKSYIYFFCVGQLLNGVGGAALLQLGLTYLDDNVSQTDSSSYHGLFLACGVVGPALGYVGGGQFLKIFTNFHEKVSITDESSLWIGAWWLGYIVSGVTIMLLAFPILLFPKYLPNTKHLRIEKKSESIENKRTKLLADDHSTLSIWNFWKSLLALCSNFMFILVVIADSLEYGLIMSLSAFGPKYVVAMFRTTPTLAATLTGIVVIVGGAAGEVLGGWIVTKMKWSVLGILRLCIVISILTGISVLAFACTCPSIAFAGSTTPYVNESRLSAYIHTASCNEMCSCNSDVYDPVCGDDGVTYYSPCLAGCKHIDLDNKKFTNCSCVNSSNAFATGGICSNSECDSTLSLFMGLLFIYVFLTFLTGAPTVQIILRVVPFELRSFSVGIKGFVNAAVGSVPMPIVMGVILDRTCSVWSYECGDLAACQLYNDTQLALGIGGLIAGTKILSAIFFGISLFIYKPSSPSNNDEDSHGAD